MRGALLVQLSVTALAVATSGSYASNLMRTELSATAEVGSSWDWPWAKKESDMTQTEIADKRVSGLGQAIQDAGGQCPTAGLMKGFGCKQFCKCPALMSCTTDGAQSSLYGVFVGKCENMVWPYILIGLAVIGAVVAGMKVAKGMKNNADYDEKMLLKDQQDGECYGAQSQGYEGQSGMYQQQDPMMMQQDPMMMMGGGGPPPPPGMTLVSHTVEVQQMPGAPPQSAGGALPPDALAALGLASLSQQPMSQQPMMGDNMSSAAPMSDFIPQQSAPKNPYD